MEALISVIVPIYKVEEYLPKCLDSIINQTYRNLEIILVDDGSPDKCPNICDKYAEGDSRIRVIHQKNGGLSNARNTGLNLAQGKYIAFVDSDDYIHKEMYSILLNAMKETGADIAEAGVQKVFHKDSIQNWNRGDKKTVFCRKAAVVSTIIDHSCRNVVWNKLYKKELWEKYRFPEGKIYEDVFTTYKVVNEASKLVKLERDLYYYYQRKESIVNQEFSVKRLDHFEAQEEMMEFIVEKYPDIAPITCIRYYLVCLYCLQMLIINRGAIEDGDNLITDLYGKLVDEKYIKYLEMKITPACRQLLKNKFSFLYREKISIKIRLFILRNSIDLFSIGINLLVTLKKWLKKYLKKKKPF